MTDIITSASAQDLREVSLPDKLWYMEHNLAPALLRFVDLTVASWAPAGLISVKDGYGLVTTQILPVGGLVSSWDGNPETDFGYGIATGNTTVRYAWNGGRKVMMLMDAMQSGLMQVSSTLAIANAFPAFCAGRGVASQESDGRILWDYFPHGGAVYRTDGIEEVAVGVSVYTAMEDNRLAGLIADWLLEQAAAIRNA